MSLPFIEDHAYAEVKNDTINSTYKRRVPVIVYQSSHIGKYIKEGRGSSMNYRLGVISDTHGHEEAWEEALSLWGKIDGVLHAGDVLSNVSTGLEKMIRTSPFPVIISKGNCDHPGDEEIIA